VIRWPLIALMGLCFSGLSVPTILAQEGSAPSVEVEEAEAQSKGLLVHRPAHEVLADADVGRSVATLPDRAAIHESMAAGLEYLLSSQNEDGSWGGWGEPAHGFWSNPHSHFAWVAGTTALCVMSLLDREDEPGALLAADRGVNFLIDQPKLKRPSDWDVDNTWGCVYGLAALVEALAHPRYAEGDRKEELRAKCLLYIDQLAGLQAPDGGWGYYDFDTLARRPSWSTSFMTAVAVLAMVRAQDVGLSLPEGMLAGAIKAVERCKLPNGAYTYSVMPVPSPGHSMGINQLKGSLARTQVCNLALTVAGSDRVKHQDLLDGLDAFFEHHRFLDLARGKPIPHEAYYQNSGYFYFFGHFYAACVLDLLNPAEQMRYQTRLAHEVVKTQEADGSMWDFYFNTYHKPYGTAFGVMTLLRTLPREQAGWSKAK
jgi:hypothetical protein